MSEVSKYPERAEKYARIIKVFVSSPGDVSKEREVMEEVVASINRTDGEAGAFRLELFRWEKNVVPQSGPNPQKVIDGQTPVYDIYLGIMSNPLRHAHRGIRKRHGEGI